MTGPPPRRLLGAASSIGERVRVYHTAEALEVDVMEYYTIRRRRVFFDEVQLVTLHTKRGLVVGAVAWGVLALLAGLTAGGAVSSGDRTAFSTLLAIAIAFALGSLISMLMPVWTVTVFGKRTRARLRFRLRAGKARRVYDEICRSVAEAQEEAAIRRAAEVSAAPAPPPLPPMPPVSAMPPTPSTDSPPPEPPLPEEGP